MSEEMDFEDIAPWLAFILTLVGGLLRVLLLGTKGMWLDETFSVWVASHNLADMLQWIIRIDQHPPLYYMLLHFWMSLTGSDPYSVRMLSVLFGTATIPVVYLIGKRLSGTLVGLGAAALLAFSPYHVYYAQETRMYTLLTFNAAVALYALVRLLTDPRAARPIGSQFRDYLRAWRSPAPEKHISENGFSYRDTSAKKSWWRAWLARHCWSPIQTIETDLAWVGLILFSAATLYSHNTAVLFILAINVAVLGLLLMQRRNQSGEQPGFQVPSLGNWAKAQAGIFILWLPWMIPFVKQSGSVYQRFWIPAPTWDGVVQVIKFFMNASGPIPTNEATVIWVLYALVFVLALVNFRKKLAQFFFLAALFAIPLLSELFVSIWRPIFYDRTLIWITIPMFLVMAVGVSQIRLRLLVFLALGCLATINVFSVGDYYRFYQKEDWKSAARDVAGYAKNGDLVLFNSNMVVVAFDYYFKSYEDFYSIEVVKRGLPQDLFSTGKLEPEMTPQDVPGLVSLVSGYPRVWLVYSHDSYTDPQGLIPQTLAAQKKLSRQEDFYGGKVQLYVNP